MPDDRFGKVKDELGELLILPPLDRQRRLQEIESEDPELRRVLDEWFLEERLAGDFLESELAFAPPPSSPIFEAGTELPGYRIVRVLGLGGMSIVYEAEQERPRRRVALKVLQRCLAHDAALARFRQEAELLARLHHPGIAAVYEVGSIADGDHDLPFIAMELIRSATAFPTTAVDSSIERDRRLRLLVELCRAVGHAHAHGVVHRDLKPENVLIDRTGCVRVIDFGIGKSLGGAACLTTPTVHGELLGTPSFMSPEQRRGEIGSIGPASDVYSLGLLLVRTIAGESSEEGTLPENFCRRSSRDLQAIAVQSLQPDPRHRYRDAEALARDLEHHLGGLPVEARSPRFFEQVAHLCRRHRTAAVSSVLCLWICVAFLGLLTLQSRSAAERESRERARAEKVTAFLQSVLSLANPRETARPELRMTEILADTAARLDASLADDPEARAQIHATLGRAWLELGRHAEAAIELEQTVALFDLDGVGSPLSAACARNALGDVYHAAARHVEARTVLEEGRALFLTVGAAPFLVAMAESKLARALAALGEFARAEELARRALDTYQGCFGPDHEAVAAGHAILASVLGPMGKRSAALEHARAALEIHGKVGRTLEVARDHLLLGSLCDQDDPEARRHAEAAVEILSELVALDHPELRCARALAQRLSAQP